MPEIINGALAKSIAFISGVAKTGPAGISSFFGGLDLDLSKIGWEWILVFFVVFVIFLSGFTYGKTKMFLGVIAIYIAVFLEQAFPYFDKLIELTKFEPEYLGRVVLFFAIYFIVLALLSQSYIKKRFSLKEFGLIPIALLSILEIGFLLSVVLPYLPEDKISQLPSNLTVYFITGLARFWWAALPIIATVLLRAGKKED